MNRNEQGFSTPVAMTVIFSLCIIILAIGTLFSTTNKKLRSIERAYSENAVVKKILSDIDNDIQLLVTTNTDNYNNPVILNLFTKYSSYNLSINDVSTGINELFMNEEFIKSDCISHLLNTEKDTVRTNYGWINSRYADKKFIQGSNNVDSFPLVNQIPFYNVYFMNQNFLEAILEYNGILLSSEKAIQILNMCNTEIRKEDLMQILNCSEDHTIFDFLSTKTTFWEICFETKISEVKAIYAAMPNEKKLKEIDHYELINSVIKRKGGNL